ncbi:hypothetical protein SAMN05216496_2980 [Pseudomonas sp. Z003-0.4C(8344-21)]|nr:hypothetical protein SAMN05216496_2980 [Pseudomonas sp. Z003-0.4C(8344-21)]
MHIIGGEHKTNVGVSLLAIACCQATYVLDVPTHSRAGSLPQDFIRQAYAVKRTPGLARSSTDNSNTSGRA